MDNQTLAQRIRRFFRDLFGSRLVDTLELRVLEIQQEHERRVRDKDDLIDSLRTDLANLRAKAELMETVLLPLVSPAGNLFKSKPEPRTFERLSAEPQPGSWQWVQAEWDKKMREEAEAEASVKEN